MKKKILIIGGGFAGCSAAEMLSHNSNHEITLLDSASFLGAGVRTFFHGGHPYTFGPRHFLTKDVSTYHYLKKFLHLRDVSYHKFISYVQQDDAFYNYPLNKIDIEKMPDKKKIKKEIAEAKGFENAINLEEFWIRSIGKTLFLKTIDEYNKKMWQVNSCKKIDTFKWSPKGYTLKDGKEAAYDDWISMYPTEKNGYNNFFDHVLKLNIRFLLSSKIKKINIKKKYLDYNNGRIKFDILINTIPPDVLFDFKYGKLKFIGRDLHKFVLPGEFAFPKDVFFLYYPNSEKITRLVEYKKFTRHKSRNTLIGVEIPSENGRYYPVPFKNEQKLAQKYFNEMPENFYSIGRAGTYRYEVDIDDCISQSIEINKQINSCDYQGPIIGDHFKIKP
jgi:UDP-galactopyranose mutase